MSDGGEVQIRFVSADYPTLSGHSLSVPLTCTPVQLKALVEGLVETKLGKTRFTNFLIYFFIGF